MMYDSSSANIIRDLEDTRKGSEIFLLGLTGGIASGKSTVAEMLEKMGSPLIDFDILARYVVRPNEPSWRCIVDFFGRDILNDDETIDRKRLSGIVFRDIEKRRKLESFTHPFIWNEFVNQVRKIGSETKNVIITCVIPLLIEGGREEIFDRIVLVYS